LNSVAGLLGIVAVALMGCGDGGRAAQPRPPTTPAASIDSGNASTDTPAKLDPEVAAEAAREYGLTPEDAPAVASTTCRDPGDCPAGV